MAAWLAAFAVGLSLGCVGRRVVEGELVGPQDPLFGVANEHEYVTTSARLLVLKPRGFARAHREVIDEGGGGIRADDLFRKLIFDYGPVGVLVAVGSRDRVPVFVERRKVWICSHDVTSLESAGA